MSGHIQAVGTQNAEHNDILTGTIDWFNPRKGYGFVKLPTSPDAYLSATVLSDAGLATIMPGATVTVEVSGPVRRNVVRVVNVDTSTSTQPVGKHWREIEDTIQASLKWYDADKGYGFLSAEGFDIFLHAKVLERAGLQAGDLSEGDRFSVGLANGDRGKVAVTIERL